MKPKIAKVTKADKAGPKPAPALSPEARLDRHDFDIAQLRLLIQGHTQNEQMHGAEERKRLDIIFSHVTALGDRLGYAWNQLTGWSKKKSGWF